MKAIEVKLVSLRSYGGKKGSVAYVLPDSVSLRDGIASRKFIKVQDRNLKTKAKFLRS